MRLPRLDHPGARHHVMNRAARGAPIFDDDDSRALFLSILADLPRRFQVRVHGYAIMPNHYHLMLESVTGGLPRAMRHLGGEFTRRFNRRRGSDGAIFRGRYHNRLVDTDAYWMHLLVYVHLNPVRDGSSDLDDAVWTSHRAFVGAVARPEWLVTEELQALFGSEAAYREACAAVVAGRGPAPEEFDPDRLWAPNSTGTVDVPDVSEPHFAVQDALAEVCAATGLELAEVLDAPRGRNGNPANWVAAWWLSRGRGIPHGEIGRALGASHSTVSQRIRRVEERRDTDPQLEEWVRRLQG